MSGVYLLPCVCGEELIGLSEAEVETAARVHLDEHRARGDKPTDFEETTE